MLRSLDYTQPPWTETYSEIIDVRSPAEFAEDHMPGAINLPVLDNAERAKVGTIYKQVNSFEARKIGASLVAQNIARHLDTHFASKGKDYHPLVYCWRGGQRSNSMGSVLSQIGWRVTVLDGGYKTYRAYVRTQVEHLPTQFTYRVLSGLTGSGKTYILRQLAHRGVQVLDLEELANHRGSLLGQEWDSGREGEYSVEASSLNLGKLAAQPSQKQFESRLVQALQNFDPTRLVWVEAESNKIGKVYLPLSLWQLMKQASCVDIQVPLAARVEWLLQEYPHFITHPDLLKQKLGYLKSRYGGKKINEWHHLIDAGQWHTLVRDLLSDHYDPAYQQSLGQSYNQVEHQLQLADLSDTHVNALLDALMSLDCLEQNINPT